VPEPPAQRLWILPLLLYMVAVFAVSSVGVPEVAAPLLAPAYADKLLHVLEYTVLGLLAVLAFHRGVWPGRWRRAALAAALVAIPFAAVEEAHQLLIPGRSADVTDFLADACGIALGLALARVLLHAEFRRGGGA